MKQTATWIKTDVELPTQGQTVIFLTIGLVPETDLHSHVSCSIAS